MNDNQQRLPHRVAQEAMMSTTSDLEPIETPPDQSPMPPVSSKPTDAALIAAYETTTQMYVNESSAVWSRFGNYLVFNTIWVAGLLLIEQIVLELPTDIITDLYSFQSVGAAAGIIYSIIWIASTHRTWSYHDLHINHMRLLENSLGLDGLGPSQTGTKASIAGEYTIDGVTIHFNPIAKFLSARRMMWITAIVFMVMYMFFLLRNS